MAGTPAFAFGCGGAFDPNIRFQNVPIFTLRRRNRKPCRTIERLFRADHFNGVPLGKLDLLDVCRPFFITDDDFGVLNEGHILPLNVGINAFQKAVVDPALRTAWWVNRVEFALGMVDFYGLATRHTRGGRHIHARLGADFAIERDNAHLHRIHGVSLADNCRGDNTAVERHAHDATPYRSKANQEFQPVLYPIGASTQGELKSRLKSPR
jgi:hypothetical protein